MTAPKKSPPPANQDGGGACAHCGALVYQETLRCPQCGKFPIKLHRCKRCGCIAAATEARCWKCDTPFEPDGDYL